VSDGGSTAAGRSGRRRGGRRRGDGRRGGRRVQERVACVKLPHVAVALEERDNRSLVGRPMAIEAPQPGPRTVYDVSYAAHLAGVSVGMTLAQARKVCPEVSVLPARVEAYRETFQVMIETLSTFTPDIEPLDLEHSWLAAGGLTPRTGLERSLAVELATHVRRDVGLCTRVGLAHGKLTSRIVTQYLAQRDVMVLPPGKETMFLGGLATRYLPLTASNHRLVAQLGLSKIRQYAALPARGILPRFGYDGLRAHELSHGRDDGHVRPWQEEPVIEVTQAFLEPVDNQRRLRHHVELLVRRATKPLAARFQMAGALTLTITFEDGHATTSRRTLVEPTVRPDTLLVHADAMIAAIEWRAPVERLTLEARGLCPTVGHQLELFRREHEERAGVEQTLRRIQAKFGDAAVLQGHRLEPDSPLPERRAYLAQWQDASRA